MDVFFYVLLGVLLVAGLARLQRNNRQVALEYVFPGESILVTSLEESAKTWPRGVTAASAWAIYEEVPDERYIVREHVMEGDGKIRVSPYIKLADSLLTARTLIPPGFDTYTPATAVDPPNLAEVWS